MGIFSGMFYLVFIFVLLKPDLSSPAGFSGLDPPASASECWVYRCTPSHTAPELWWYCWFCLVFRDRFSCSPCDKLTIAQALAPDRIAGIASSSHHTPFPEVFFYTFTFSYMYYLYMCVFIYDVSV